NGAHISTSSNVTGFSDIGTGAVVEGNISNHGIISGNSNKGDGLNLSGIVSGGGQLTGNSVNGTGVHVSEGSALNGGRLTGNTTNGSGLHLDGDLKYTSDSTISSGVVAGGKGQKTTGKGRLIEVNSNNPDDKPGKPEIPELGKQTEKMMGAIIAQTLERGTVLQTSDYRLPDELVEIEVCIDGKCNSLNIHRQISSVPEESERMPGINSERK
ncbi:hypothetical protein ADQ49_27795, partial [Salmonella enterica subsp. enterica]|nr:hypothetical protein [Salmonella enterica subsp. enterica serovar Enteritidis]